MTKDLREFIEKHMRKGGRYVPARLQAAIALLERLREAPALRLEDHKKPNSAGLESHETMGARAHQRMGLEILNKTHGRRSSDIGGWGQALLDRLKAAGFEKLAPKKRSAIIDDFQSSFASVIRGILEQDPLEVQVRGRSAEAVIGEILKQAEAKGKAGDIAQYLVGAKLMIRLNIEIPVVGSNRGDRKSRLDPGARRGDFEIENAIIEVAVGPPDEKHITQVSEALEDTDLEVWLLTRQDRVDPWRREIKEVDGVDFRRVVVTSVESFVGQNMSEMGGFSNKGRISKLRELFEVYNDRWIARVGTPGLRIIVK